MSSEPHQQIVQALWPQGSASTRSVWAVLDCARDPAIYRLLLESRLEFLSLYSGRLPRELEMVSPHMVELLPGHRFVDQLLDQGWGRAWGIFLTIGDPSNLRHHLRKFLKVQDETGQRLLFRYYDPRVLRAYLPTCTPDELRFVFGPVDSYCVEAADPDAGIVSYRLHRGALQATTSALAASA
ncbi:MAG: DUF4123 domain-containing protein [Rubrivivax sp.]|nr:DUF4123 domain-containing protein [Rubrivivax sp.]